MKTVHLAAAVLALGAPALLHAQPLVVPPAFATPPVVEATQAFLKSGTAPILDQALAELHPFGHSIPSLRCAPLTVCDIELQPGETVLDIAIGDSTRWNLGQMTSGTPPAPHVVVKPMDFDLETNLLVSTDRRTYSLSLSSPSKAEAARLAPRRIAFYYPDEVVMHLAAADAARAQREAASIAPLAVDPTRLNYNYRVKPTGHRIAPLRVLDDGVRTYIQLPASSGPRRETPALLAVAADGKPQILNYRMSGDWLVADGTFARAELLIGAGRGQAKISISNEAADGR